MELIIFLLLIPLIRAVIFFYDWRFFVKVSMKHKTYIAGAGKNSSKDKKELSFNAAEWLTENITEIKRRVEKAGIKDPQHAYMEAKGYGYVGQTSMSALDNLLYLNETILGSAITILNRTKGYYKNQAIRSINPLFWLETLFFLPKAIVSASGIDASSKLADTGLKITQIIYWAVILITVIMNPELIKVLIENIKT